MEISETLLKRTLLLLKKDIKDKKRKKLPGLCLTINIMCSDGIISLDELKNFIHYLHSKPTKYYLENKTAYFWPEWDYTPRLNWIEKILIDLTKCS